MAGLVLSDSSPLIALGRVGGLSWLHALFGTVCMPEEVRRELLPGFGFAEEQDIAAAIAAGWLLVRSPTPAEPLLPELDEGESACIRLALAHDAPVLLLIDDRAGRAIATERGLRVAGTAAVIGRAKTNGLIPSARAVFARLHESDFRLSAKVIDTVLRSVGEAR
jgi:predicted nucleic acid-binding protein